MLTVCNYDISRILRLLIIIEYDEGVKIHAG